MKIQSYNSLEINVQKQVRQVSANESRTESTNVRPGSDTVSISPKAKYAENSWQKVSSDYNPHDLSRSERGQLTNSLVADGVITNDIAMQLVKPLKMNEGPNDRSDFLGTLKQSYEFNKGAGLSQEQLYAQLKAIEVLEKIKEIRTSNNGSV